MGDWLTKKAPALCASVILLSSCASLETTDGVGESLSDEQLPVRSETPPTEEHHVGGVPDTSSSDASRARSPQQSRPYLDDVFRRLSPPSSSGELPPASIARLPAPIPPEDTPEDTPEKTPVGRGAGALREPTSRISNRPAPSEIRGPDPSRHDRGPLTLQRVNRRRPLPTPRPARQPSPRSDTPTKNHASTPAAGTLPAPATPGGSWSRAVRVARVTPTPAEPGSTPPELDSSRDETSIQKSRSLRPTDLWRTSEDTPIRTSRATVPQPARTASTEPETTELPDSTESPFSGVTGRPSTGSHNERATAFPATGPAFRVATDSASDLRPEPQARATQPAPQSRRATDSASDQQPEPQAQAAAPATEPSNSRQGAERDGWTAAAQPSTPQQTADLDAPIPAVRDSDEDDLPVYEEEARVSRENHELRVDLPGLGWIFVGEKSGKDLHFVRKELPADSSTRFVFREPPPSDYRLSFQVQDLFSGERRQREVLISEDTLTTPPGRREDEEIAPASDEGLASPSTEDAPHEEPTSVAAGEAVDPLGPENPAASEYSPRALLIAASEAETAGRYGAAIQFLEAYILTEADAAELDEIYFRLGQLYEMPTDDRDFRLSRDYYKKVVDDYPFSTRWDASQARVEYITRHFFQIR